MFFPTRNFRVPMIILLHYRKIKEKGLGDSWLHPNTAQRSFFPLQALYSKKTLRKNALKGARKYKQHVLMPPGRIGKKCYWPLQKIPYYTIMLFVCRPKMLHKHCLQLLLGPFISQEKLKTMLMQNFGVRNKEHYGMLWYFLEWSIENTFSALLAN